MGGVFVTQFVPTRPVKFIEGVVDSSEVGNVPVKVVREQSVRVCAGSRVLIAEFSGGGAASVPEVEVAVSGLVVASQVLVRFHSWIVICEFREAVPPVMAIVNVSGAVPVLVRVTGVVRTSSDGKMSGIPAV